VFNNAQNEGQARAEYLAASKTFAALANAAYGPHWKSIFQRQLQECAADCAAYASPNDPVLMLCWAQICEDHSWSTDEDCNEEARRRYLANLTNSPVRLHIY
jgi:hypothetical protein